VSAETTSERVELVAQAYCECLVRIDYALGSFGREAARECRLSLGWGTKADFASLRRWEAAVVASALQLRLRANQAGQ